MKPTEHELSDNQDFYNAIKVTNYKGGTSMEQKELLDNWDAFTGSFLKADMVDETIGLVCHDVTLFEEEGEKTRPRLVFDKNGTELLFDLNKTNSDKCKTLGIASPKLLKGKVIFFKKVLVTSPKTKQEVESLRISKIV